MILTKKIDVKIINHNLLHYKNLGYNVKYGDLININVEHLSNGSHIKIDVMCDKCGKISKIKYQDYLKITKNKSREYFCQICVKKERTEKTLMQKYGVNNVSKSDIIKERKRKTTIKNWGVDNVFQNQEIKNKIISDNINKYGCCHHNQSDIIKQKTLLTRVKKGKQINPLYYKEYSLYKKKVLCVTRKYKKELLNNWDGYDYYDKEYIKENYNLNPNNKKYPTIDHKISVYYGFINNMDYNIIGNINNLCITKKCINSSKMNKNYNEYI